MGAGLLAWAEGQLEKESVKLSCRGFSIKYTCGNTTRRGRFLAVKAQILKCKCCRRPGICWVPCSATDSTDVLKSIQRSIQRA